jgi:hypothetical protein
VGIGLGLNEIPFFLFGDRFFKGGNEGLVVLPCRVADFGIPCRERKHLKKDSSLPVISEGKPIKNQRQRVFKRMVVVRFIGNFLEIVLEFFEHGCNQLFFVCKVPVHRTFCHAKFLCHIVKRHPVATALCNDIRGSFNDTAPCVLFVFWNDSGHLG